MRIHSCSYSVHCLNVLLEDPSDMPNLNQISQLALHSFSVTLMSVSIRRVHSFEVKVPLIGKLFINFLLQKTKSLQQEIELLTQRLEELYGLNEEAVQESTPNEENSWEQKRPFKCLEGKIASNDFFQRKSDLDWKKVRVFWGVGTSMTMKMIVLLITLLLKAITTVCFYLIDSNEPLKHLVIPRILSSPPTSLFLLYRYLMFIVVACLYTYMLKIYLLIRF